jgi:hypothetical protein
MIQGCDTSGRGSKNGTDKQYQGQAMGRSTSYQAQRTASTSEAATSFRLPESLDPLKQDPRNLEQQSQHIGTLSDFETMACMNLAPITGAERERVSRCMSNAAKAATNMAGPSHAFDPRLPEEHEDAGAWFRADARGEMLLREQVQVSAYEYAERVAANVKVRNDGVLSDRFRHGRDDGLAASLIIGNVACNLQTYIHGDRGSIEQQRNFFKVKSVPDWCTEKSRPCFSGGERGDSYFDDTTDGFHIAPVRVARDPRFRP